MELLSAAKHGDQAAFAEIVGPLENRLFQTALGIVGNRQDAQDVWQDTVLKAWTGLRGLRKNEYFSTWFTRILLNEAKQVLRRRTRQPILVAEIPETLVDKTPDYERALLVQSSLARLPEAQRTAILLRYWLDFSLEEMALAMAVPLSTAKTRLYQGQAALKTLMEEVDEYVRAEA